MLTGNRVVVTGMGVLAPNGIGLEEFWRTLLAGESGIGPVTLFDASDLKCQIAGEVTGFDPHKYIDPKLKPKKRMARASQFAIAATTLALEDAGLTVENLRASGRIPLTIGVSTSAMDLREQPPRSWSAVAGVPHATTSAISFVLGFDAEMETISDGCASSIDAIAKASKLIREGVSDIAIAGGADSAMSHYIFKCFTKSRKLSTRNDEPKRASRPFDRDSDGGTIAEGAAIVILENLEHALARGVKLYGEIAGYGSCGDNVSSKAEGCGIGNSMRLAMACVPIPCTQVDHISAHGPSDTHMDRIETEMIKEVFGDHAYQIPVVSIKGVVGNPLGVGGAHQLIASALSLQNNVIPPTANLENPDPLCDLDYVPKVSRTVNLNTILLNTHGFGRGNSSLILKRVEI